MNKKLFYQITTLLIVTVMVFCLSSCKGNNQNTSSPKPTVTWRQEFNESVKTASTDNDGKFEFNTVDWKGPSGYVIIIPSGNVELRKAAESLQSYYKKLTGDKLSISTDKVKETKKEILIGNTNRKESAKKLAENKICVSVENNKLVFCGGHNITVKTAVEKFIRTNPEKEKANVFEIETDFNSTALDGYKYVWGDEFEGSDIDLTKWEFSEKMYGTAMMHVSYDKDTVSVEDGRLKLHALRVKDLDDEDFQFKVPYSVATEHHMNFVYGYAEIRAKMPFTKGVWPSFWTQSTSAISGKRNPKYFVEVDVFEVFGSLNEVVPNIHKWYNKNYYDYDAIHKTNIESHSSYGILNDVKKWEWQNVDTIGQEYHTYGWEWTPKELSMYVDGTKYMTFDISKSFDLCSDNSGFSDPEFVMFNFHVFSPDYNYIKTPIMSSLDSLPSEYDIDYFRLYQKPGQGKLYTDETPSEYSDRK